MLDGAAPCSMHAHQIPRRRHYSTRRQANTGRKTCPAVVKCGKSARRPAQTMHETASCRDRGDKSGGARWINGYRPGMYVSVPAPCTLVGPGQQVFLDNRVAERVVSLITRLTNPRRRISLYVIHHRFSWPPRRPPPRRSAVYADFTQ